MRFPSTTTQPDRQRAVAFAAPVRDGIRDARRARAEGGPADLATYPCDCGYVFVARVSTSVSCPHCNTAQAWQEAVAVATADLTVLSLGRADVSASAYVAEIQRRLAAQDRVGYVMHAMGTSLEGEVADILALVGELHAVPFELGIPRVYSVLKLDERRDRAQSLADKVASVERRLDEDT